MSGQDEKTEITVGPLKLNSSTRTITVIDEITAEEKPVALQPKEFSIIELLILRKGTEVTREDFMRHIYGADESEWPSLKNIDVQLCKARKKIMDTGNFAADPIENVWGRGYIIIDETTPPDISAEKEVLGRKKPDRTNSSTSTRSPSPGSRNRVLRREHG